MLDAALFGIDLVLHLEFLVNILQLHGQLWVLVTFDELESLLNRLHLREQLLVDISYELVDLVRISCFPNQGHQLVKFAVQ